MKHESNMNNIKASFYDPAKLNNSVPEYFRQTKNFKGIDANIEYLFNDVNAEWQIIGTWVDDISKIIDKKIIYLQQEPPECKLPSLDLLNHVKCAITPFHLNHPVKQYINSTPLPWTYDLNVLNCRKNGHTTTLASNLELNALKYESAPKKNKLCSFIVSTKSFLPGQKKRVEFAKKIMSHFNNKIDYYGFGFNPVKNKKDAIDPYLFSIAIENSNYNNYWTEKIADVFLGYTCPIYYGCSNINNYFDESSYIAIDINNIDFSISKIEYAFNNISLYQEEKIALSRSKVLEDYNFFNIISKTINKEFS